MFIFWKIPLIIMISLSLSNDISKQALLNNSFIELLKIINYNIDSNDLIQSYFNECQKKLFNLSYDDLYEIVENSGKQESDLGNFWVCKARNYSYHILNNKNEKNKNSNIASLFLRKNYSNIGLCIPKECNDILHAFVNSDYYKEEYFISNTSIYSYIPDSNKEEKKSELEIVEIVSIILLIIIIFILVIKILTPIVLGTCLYKYNCLQYSKGNIYTSIEDTITDDEELIDDDDNVHLFRNNKLNEIKKEEEEKHKNTTEKYIVFTQNLLSFFRIDINLHLLFSDNNFLYNNNLLQPIYFFKSIILFIMFYNESFYILVILPMKNSNNENFYYSWSMIFLKFSTFSVDIYIAIEGLLFSYKLFNYIVKHHNSKTFGYTLLLFYSKTIPKIITCLCAFFIFNIGLKVIEKKMDLSPFVDYIRTKHQRKCEINLSYIFIPFKLQYYSNNTCLPRFYELCYRYMYINLNIQISISFSLLIIYLVFKFRDILFDKIILIVFFLNSILSPFSCHHDLGDYFNIYTLGGETCTIKYSHLFINKFFFGMICGIIYFYHNDIISQTPIGKIYFKDRFIPFSYCQKLMKILDRISPGFKIILIIVSLLIQLLLSTIFIFYERTHKSIIFVTNGFDWVFIDNYEKKIFIFFFMLMLINLLFINKVSNSMIYNRLIFNLISRSSFSMFCTMHMIIFFVYSNYYIKIYLNFHNVLCIAISHFVICLFINVVFTILTEQSVKIVCKNTFGAFQVKLDMKTIDLDLLVKYNFKKPKKRADNSLEGTFELY